MQCRNAGSSCFPLIAENGQIQEDRYSQFVNERSRISFYGDFLYPLAKRIHTGTVFSGAAGRKFCDELKECRTKIWEALHEFPMKLSVFHRQNLFTLEQPESFYHCSPKKSVIMNFWIGSRWCLPTEKNVGGSS